MRSASFFHIPLLLALVPAPLAAGTDTPPIVLPMDRIIPPLPDGDFGRSMDIAGDLAVIGAPHFVVGDRGEVHVYRRIGPLWVQEAKITPEGYQWPTILDGDWTPVMFGAAVAAGPDTVAIGAPSYFSTPNGTVFVYHRSGGVWSLQATLQEPAPATSAFGSTLDLEGDTLVVGGANRAYVYTRSAGVWSHRVLLAPPSGASFARQVAIDGDTIVAGSPGEESGKGAAYVFTGGGTAWSLQARIVASGLQPLDYFGTRIAIDGSTIVVGAPDTDYLRGAAYVFVRQGTSWAQQAKLLDPGPTRYPELFGHSLSIAGDTVVAGRP